MSIENNSLNSESMLKRLMEVKRLQAYKFELMPTGQHQKSMH